MEYFKIVEGETKRISVLAAGAPVDTKWGRKISMPVLCDGGEYRWEMSQGVYDLLVETVADAGLQGMAGVQAKVSRGVSSEGKTRYEFTPIVTVMETALAEYDDDQRKMVVLTKIVDLLVKCCLERAVTSDLLELYANLERWSEA